MDSADVSSKMVAPGFDHPPFVAEVSIKPLQGCVQWRLEATQVDGTDGWESEML